MAGVGLILTMMMVMSLSLSAKSEPDLCGEQQHDDACPASDKLNDDPEDEEILLIEAIVDLDRYPIHQRGPEYYKLVEDCQKQLKAVGSVDLEGFIRRDVIEKMAMEVDNLPSYNRLNLVSPYGAAIDDEPLKVNFTSKHNSRQPHPSQRLFAQDTNAVAFDQVPLDTLIRKVYDSNLFMDFLAHATGKDRMYQMEDEFQGINIMYMYDGCSRAWHYDGTDTVITLLLQKAAVGGEYEFAPFIRGEEKGDERFEDVAKLFEGTYDGSIVKNADAGTLNLFNGIRSLHRVRAVYGPTKRIVAVLSYDTKPHVRGSYTKNVVLYGERVENIYKLRGLLPA